jgi:drug/metabolite transporter (DMT)-like permease
MDRHPRLESVAQALFVTFLWSTSWVLIKIGLQEVPALTFAGLRYVLAFVVLVPVLFIRGQSHLLGEMTRATWIRLAVFGLLFIAVTQGAQFVALSDLPAVSVNLFLSLTIVIVAFLGLMFLHESPGKLQWFGIALALTGALVYFLPSGLAVGHPQGMLATAICLVANAISSTMGRDINRRGDLPPLLVTTVSMGFGAVVLLGAGWVSQGLPQLSLNGWLIIGWMAVVNTSFAFTLWNRTLRTLTAVESSVIANTMAIQIPILAVLFLGESLTGVEIGGLIMAAVGTLVVQLPRRRQSMDPAFDH